MRCYDVVVAVVLITIFATGDWEAAGKRDAAKPSAEDEEEEGQDAYGDFEDLETGQCGSSRCLTENEMLCMSGFACWPFQ